MKFVFLALAFCVLASAAYVELEPKDYLDNDIVEDGLNYGANYIIQSAINRNVLPEGNYTVVNLTKVEEQKLTNGLNYRYNVHIQSTNGVNVRGRFTIYYRNSNQTYKVVSQNWNYRYPSDLNDLENEEYYWEDYEFENEEEEWTCEEVEEENEWTCEEEGTNEEWTCDEEETVEELPTEEPENPTEEDFPEEEIVIIVDVDSP